MPPLARHVAGIRHFVISAKTGGLAQALFAVCTFHVNLLEARRGYLPGNWDVLWSLSVEEMFYLFFPLLCRWLGRGRLFVALLVVLVVLGPFGRTSLAGNNEVWREYSYLGGMDAIALGCFTALLGSKFGSHFGRVSLRLIGGAGAMLLIFSLGFSLLAARWGLERTGLSMTIVAAGACLVILVAARTGWKSPRVLAPLRMLGQRSYEVYLTHMFVVVTIFGLFASKARSLSTVPPLFLAVILYAGVLGELVARLYSETDEPAVARTLGRTPFRLLDRTPGALSALAFAGPHGC